VHPVEHLKAHFLGMRTQALRNLRDLTANMRTNVKELQNDVKMDVEKNHRFFENYPIMAKPKNYEEQRARNTARGELQKVTRKSVSNLKALVLISQEPADSLCKARNDQLERIDSAMKMLQELRAETVSMFEGCEQDCEGSPDLDAAGLALTPHIQCLDRFVQHVTPEIDEETEQAAKVHSKNLEELRKAQERFVAANDCPKRNPIFAKVIEDIESTERVLAEHRNASASQKSLVQEWQEVMDTVPVQKQSVPSPQRSSMWGRLFGRA